VTITVNNSSPVFKEKIPSIQVVRRNILKLLGIFAIAYVPVFLLNLLFDTKGFVFANNDTASSASAMQKLITDEVILFVRELAFTFTVLCCAFISESTIEGYSVGFTGVLRHGIKLFWKALLTVLPIILAKMLLSGFSSVLMESSACLSLLILFPILFLTIFELFLVTTVSLRGEHGCKTYTTCWYLAKDDWWKLITEYITSVIVIVALACPIYLPIIWIFRSDIARLPGTSSFIGDLLYLWVIIEMVLRFLAIERSKAIPSQGISEQGTFVENDSSKILDTESREKAGGRSPNRDDSSV
jgi:hypothetical protein